LYTLAKLATIVKMKRDAEARGLRAVAFFWLATEDHDYDEAATLAIPSKLVPNAPAGGDLVTLKAQRRSQERLAIGRVEIPQEAARELDAMLGLESPGWLREGITFGDSFAELIASVFGDEVVLIDALLPELRRAGGPLLASIAARNGEAQEALATRAAELRDAGYREQVTARGDDYTLLFELGDDGIRRPLDRGAEVPPESISTSALTRPLLQDVVLQPDVFVGGPAEVAYYAQVGALHELFGVAQPRVALRGHALVAPYRLLRSAEKYGLPLDGVFRPAEELIAPSESGAVREVEAAIAQAKRDLMTAVGRVSELALPAEHALAARIQRSVGHLEYHLGKLEERSVRALLRRDRERFDIARKLVATLYPDGHVQDRVVSWLALWGRYGSELVDRLIEEIEPDTGVYLIVPI
ncbi:MAG: bacillithiol biosynthesis BshC, partial [Thermoanaerobaculia bacterium]